MSMSDIPSYPRSPCSIPFTESGRRVRRVIGRWRSALECKSLRNESLRALYASIPDHPCAAASLSSTDIWISSGTIDCVATVQTFHTENEILRTLIDTRADPSKGLELPGEAALRGCVALDDHGFVKTGPDLSTEQFGGGGSVLRSSNRIGVSLQSQLGGMSIVLLHSLQADMRCSGNTKTD